jgi:sRNA-binding protein
LTRAKLEAAKAKQAAEREEQQAAAAAAAAAVAAESAPAAAASTVRGNAFFEPALYIKNDRLTKTGSGQTYEKLRKRAF